MLFSQLLERAKVDGTFEKFKASSKFYPDSYKENLLKCAEEASGGKEEVGR